MSPFWVVQRFRPRFWDLAPFAALQLERRGYLVLITRETVGIDQYVIALVVLAVRPRWCWLLEFVRRESFRRRPWRRSRSSSSGGSYGAL